MKELTHISATDIAHHVARRSVSAFDVASAFMNRVEEFNHVVNAVVTIAPDFLDQAKAIDDRLQKGGFPRRLEGVPFVVKDNIYTRGLRTTNGSFIFKDFIPAENALCVQRILDAGGVLLGKTNTSEFATDINTYNPLFGVSRNPLDLRVSGKDG